MVVEAIGEPLVTPAEHREGEARGQRWTIYLCPACGAHSGEVKPGGWPVAHHALSGIDHRPEPIFVVPADDKRVLWARVEQLVGALERLEHVGTQLLKETPPSDEAWEEHQLAILQARVALDSVQEGEKLYVCDECDFTTNSDLAADGHEHLMRWRGSVQEGKRS